MKEINKKIETILTEAVQNIFNELEPAVKEDVNSIQDEKLKEICKNYVAISEDILALFKKDKYLENFSKSDRVIFVSAASYFNLKIQEFFTDYINKSLKNKEK